MKARQLLVPLLPLLLAALSSLLLMPATTASAFSVPWAYDGFDRVPALWFGANATGLDNSSTLAFIGRHSLAGYGWQQGTQLTGFRFQETALAQAAAALKQAQPQLPVFVYRHSQAAFPMFELTRPLVAAVAGGDHATQRDMFVQLPDGRVCAQGAPSADNATLRYAYPYNWSAPGPMQLWTQSVTLEVSLESAVDAVFHDEVDWSYCDYFHGHETNCSGQLSDALLADLYRAKVQGVRAIGLQLNAAGKVPIFSSKNQMQVVYRPKVTPPCVLPEDVLTDALGGVVWLRFYEFWVSENNADLNAQMILNAIVETNGTVKTGAPAGFVARYQYSNSTGSAGVTFALAAFLVAQSPYSYFGISTGWYDANWQWWPQYDSVRCGAPTAAAVVVSAYEFTRTFEHCKVSVNTMTSSGDIQQVD